MRNLKIYPTEKVFRDEMTYLFNDSIKMSLDIKFKRNNEIVRIEKRSLYSYLEGNAKIYRKDLYYENMLEKHNNEKYNMDLFYSEIGEDGEAILIYYDIKDFFYNYKFRDGKVLIEVLDECEIEYM